MKKLLLIFAGALLSLTAYAQFTCTLNSQRSYGGSDDEFVPAFAKTADGGYVVACWSASGDKDLTRNKGSYDFWVFKTKSNGDIEWQKNFGGSSRDQSNSILTLKNGGYLVTGHTLSNDSDITKNYGGQDGILMKIDKNGNLAWLKCYGGTGEDELFSAIETDDGKFIACGYTNSNDGMVAGNHGNKDVWLIKTDSNGNLLWQQPYGGGADDVANAICKSTTANMFFITGYTFSSNGNFGTVKGSADGLLFKVDSSGTILNSSNSGGTMYDAFSAMAQTSDGGCIVTGFTESANGDIAVNKGQRDVWYAKFGTTANLQWSKTFGGTGSDYGNSVIQLTDGSYAMSANSSSNDSDITGNKGANDILIALIKSNGALAGTKCFGGGFSEYSSSILAEGNNNYSIICNTASNNGDISKSNGGNDIWLINVHAVVSSTGMDSYAQTMESVYPNPACQFITVNNFPYESFMPYEVISLQGEAVLGGVMSRDNRQIDISSLRNGLYILKTEAGCVKFSVLK